MRVTLVIFSLSGLGGGMERSATNLANGWAEAGHDVSVLTLDSPDKMPLYPLHETIHFEQLHLNKPAANKLMAVKGMAVSAKALRAAIRRVGTEVAVAFGDQTCILTLAGCVGTGNPVIVAERTHPAHYSIGRGWGPLRKVLYPNAASLVAQTQDIARWYSANLRSVRIDVIPNVVEPGLPKVKKGAGDRKTVIGIGMLAPVKQFDVLIKAFSRVAHDHPGWDLVLYGEGPDRTALEQQADALGYGERISFPGRVDDLPDRIARADVFVLTSRTEGFPNALCEAMAGGLPAVSFDCPSGPSEIIRDGVDGYLVPPGDVDELESRMGELMEDDALRRDFSSRAVEVAERFSAETVFAKWDALLRKVRKG